MRGGDYEPDFTFGDKLKLFLLVAGLAVAILGWPLMTVFS